MFSQGWYTMVFIKALSLLFGISLCSSLSDVPAERAAHHMHMVSGNRLVDIGVTSSRQQLNLTVNGVEVLQSFEESGLHIIVLSQYDAKVLIHRVFLTTKYGMALGIIPLLQSLAPGRILVMAVKDDAGLNLSQPVRDYFKTMGAQNGHLLPYHGYFAWICTVGGVVWGEGMVSNSSQDLGFIHSPVHLEVQVPLVESNSCVVSRDINRVLSPLDIARNQFCQRYDGYGDLCACLDPTSLQFPNIQMYGSVIKEVPLAIITANRPSVLYRTLLTVLKQPGGSRKRILVLVDGQHQEVEELLKLLQVRYVVHDTESENIKFGSMGARISYHYRWALNTTFSLFPSTNKAIVLEDDLLAAPDFFSYFNQTSWLLDHDPSLFCISAWNDLGSMHVARHPRRLYRIESHAGCGFMLTRQFFNEVFPIWPDPLQNHDWDIWFRSTKIRGERECVVPDVSRTFHFAHVGAHIAPDMQQAQFTGHIVTTKHGIKLDNVDRMPLSEYEEDLINLLTSPNIHYVNTSLHPCHYDFIPRNFTVERPCGDFHKNGHFRAIHCMDESSGLFRNMAY